MKSISVLLKENLTAIPFPLGDMLANIPYDYRPGLGKIYSDRKKNIEELDKASLENKKAFVLKKLQKLTEYAYRNIPFYKKYYTEQRFNPAQLKTFEDIQRIPIINKTLLQQWDIEDRSFKTPNRYVVNTGGSSGKPLSLYISPDSMGHEWAHMHTIWQKIGFKQSDLKVSFGGRADSKNFLSYDAVRHSYNFNIYQDLNKNKTIFIDIAKNRKVKYLHGYPSAIYELAVFCRQEQNNDLREALKSNLVGAFFGSEYPIPAWRTYIEETFGIASVSWYGHTERSILAYEKNEKYVYYPFLSYGYTESCKIDQKEHLIGTSYYNFSSPLIRYDTEDLIKPTSFEGDILRSFEIAEGRIGEFITDKDGKKIPLTGLIFGRHHKLFDKSKYIQVNQKEPGKATILYTPIDYEQKIEAEKYFDSRDIAITFDFKAVEKPVKTPAGKIRLLVKN